MARIVLVADDSPTIQKKALGILKGEGFEVETVSNGVAAIKRLAVLHPVVILADVSMPGRDGYEVCDFVKKSAEFSRVPVLLVASDMEPYDDARGAEVKADGIIKKPFEPQDLISIVVKFADKFEASAPPIAAPVKTPALPVPVPEFVVQDETPEEAPAVTQQVTPDFSAASEGVAFEEAAPEEAPAYSPEPVAEAPAYSPEPAAEESYPLEPTPAEAYSPEPAAAEAYSPEAAVVETYSHEPAAAEAYSSEPAVAEAYSPEPAVAETYSSEPASEESYTPEPALEEREVSHAEPTTDPGIPLEHLSEPTYSEPIPAHEPETAPVEETPVAMEAHSDQSLEEPSTQSAPPPHLPPLSVLERAPSFLEGLEAAHEPVFIEESPEPAPVVHSDVAEVRTMIFRAPMQIAEPVLRDETVPVPPEPEPAAAMAVETQIEAEAPAAAPEIAEDHPPEPEPAAPHVTATSLDSFSLEDASAGQVHFASHTTEVAAWEASPSAPAEESFAAETVSSESAPVEESFAAETVSSEPEPVEESFAAETAFAEPSPEPVEVAPQETAEEPAPQEPPAEVAVHAPPEVDWGLVYAVIHKVVLRMSPPALPIEAVEEMARRLADEIATEISTELSPPAS